MVALKAIIALTGIIVAVYLLIKKYETRTVLIGVGLFMAIATLNPMGALDAFAEKHDIGRANYGNLFEYGLCLCDEIYAMRYAFSPFINKTIKWLEVFLIPIATIITFFINIAIPSIAGQWQPWGRRSFQY